MPKQFQARVEYFDQDGGGLGLFLVGILVKVVLPKVNDLELCLFAVGQEVLILAGGVVAGTAADHLLQFDLGVDGAHKDEVDDFGDVDAGL